MFNEDKYKKQYFEWLLRMLSPVIMGFKSAELISITNDAKKEIRLKVINEYFFSNPALCILGFACENNEIMLFYQESI